jgi:plasmid maintenance system antidote protein VapI
MKPVGLSTWRVAKETGVSTLRISQIVHGSLAVSADMPCA